MNPDTLVSVLIYGIPLWIALVIILFRWGGRKVVELDDVDTCALEGDLTEFVRHLNKN